MTSNFTPIIEVSRDLASQPHIMTLNLTDINNWDSIMFLSCFDNKFMEFFDKMASYKDQTHVMTRNFQEIDGPRQCNLTLWPDFNKNLHFILDGPATRYGNEFDDN